MTDSASSKHRIFIVIAAYNESSSVRRVVESLIPEYPWIVVVDDGSTDDTHQQLEGLELFLLRHVINRGQGASLETGIRFALQKGADVIVTFDADGQHEPEEGATARPGNMEIDEANEMFGFSIDSHHYTTVGGYVFGSLGRLPRVGDKVSVKSGTLEVIEMDDRRVGVLRIRPDRDVDDSTLSK